LSRNKHGIMERSIKFNNAGVDCIEAGHHRVAWDLFKGALEVKLAVERGEKQGISDECVLNTMHNSYVNKAAGHLSNLDSYMAAVVMAPAITQPPPSTDSTTSRYQQIQHVPPSDSLYSPYLYCHPIRLQEGAAFSSRRESATIIYNLALVDHMKHRCSEQSVALYELAMTLMTGDTVDILGIALVNNIGVWCYENGDIDGALICMDHLSSFLNAGSALVDQEEKEGLNSNILWLTHPPFASPAA
jgi:hypothetical protein